MRAGQRWVLVGAAGVLIASSVVAAGGWWWLRVPPVDADWPTARSRFEKVLNGALDQEAQALSSLAGALRRQPDHARSHLWFGIANLHGFIRHRELPFAIRASRALSRAVELDGDDTSAAGWQAFFAYQAARSRERDLSEARAALLAAAERDPRFTPFLAAVALASLPLESGFPARVLAPLEAIEDCGDGTSHSCRTSPFYPHGAEGYHATLGDLRIRLGDLEGGRRAYARALEMKSAQTWPYREAFVAWTSEAEMRMALLTNADSSDDPPVFFARGARACAACHEQ
ncbi:MAG: hypothetical protein AAFU79_22050 [Myxococcota bacterium]